MELCLLVYHLRLNRRLLMAKAKQSQRTLPPVPRPLVRSLPIWTLFWQVLAFRAWASVLIAQNSTFCRKQYRHSSDVTVGVGVAGTHVLTD